MNVPARISADGLTQFVFRVHDDGAVPGDGLFERLAGDEEEADALFTGLNGLIAAIEEDERLVAD